MEIQTMIQLIKQLFLSLNISNSDEIVLPKDPLDRIVGQEKAKMAMLRALEQDRHVLLIGAPGVGKSAISKAISKRLTPSYRQMLVMPNYVTRQQPIVKIASPSFNLKKYQQEKGTYTFTLSSMAHFVFIVIISYIIFSALIKCALCYPLLEETAKESGSSIVGVFLKFFIYLVLSTTIQILTSRSFYLTVVLSIPALVEIANACLRPTYRDPLVDAVVAHVYDATFIDATGAGLSELFGTILHDPYSGFFVHTNVDPTHRLVVPGEIHKANEGILYIDEIGTLSRSQQYALLTLLQQRKAPISGATSRTGSNAHAKTNTIPCQFRLIMAGNYETKDLLHKALRSRIQSYGYEVYVEDKTKINLKHTNQLLIFFKTNIEQQGYPRFEKDALLELLYTAANASGVKDHYTLRLREFSCILRDAADIAREQNRTVRSRDIRKVVKVARTIESQVIDTLFNIDSQVGTRTIVSYTPFIANKRFSSEEVEQLSAIIEIGVALKSVDYIDQLLLFTNKAHAHSVVDANRLNQIIALITYLNINLYKNYNKYLVDLKHSKLEYMDINYSDLVFTLLVMTNKLQPKGGKSGDIIVYIGTVDYDGNVGLTVSQVTQVTFAIQKGYFVCTSRKFLQERNSETTLKNIYYIDNISELESANSSSSREYLTFD